VEPFAPAVEVAGDRNLGSIRGPHRKIDALPFHPLEEVGTQLPVQAVMAPFVEKKKVVVGQEGQLKADGRGGFFLGHGLLGHPGQALAA
jgi:hypothetical protein